MNAFEFALTIIALFFVFRLIKLVMIQKNTGARRREDEGVNADLLQRLGEVEERVRVLERIVTDQRFDLKQQFKDLES